MIETKRLKVGFLIPEFPGQTHSFFWREICCLGDKYGFETTVISTRLPPQPVQHEWVRYTNPKYLYPLKISDVGTLIIQSKRLLRLFQDKEARLLMSSIRSWGLIFMALKLGKMCARQGVDHLHVHSCAASALLAAFCHKLYGLSYSLVLHGPFSDYGVNHPYKWRDAAFGFVITQKLYKDAHKEVPDAVDKIHVVPMGVDVSTFTPAQATARSKSELFRWFCCARLNKVKGFDTLFEAVRLIREQHPRLKFHICIAGEDEQGGAGYRQVLEHELDKHAMHDWITLLGAIPQSDVLKHLQNSDGFVLASLHEPLGVAYMEAMACGLPTIGTNAGGVAELIEDRVDGLLVPPRQADALAKAMLAVMNSSELRTSLGVRAQQKIETQFSAVRSAEVLSSLVS